MIAEAAPLTPGLVLIALAIFAVIAGFPRLMKSDQKEDWATRKGLKNDDGGPNRRAFGLSMMILLMTVTTLLTTGGSWILLVIVGIGALIGLARFVRYSLTVKWRLR